MFLTRYRPMNEIDRWLRHLDSTRPSWSGFFTTDENGGEAKESRLPRTNIDEKSDRFVLTLEMPGIGKKDVDVSFEGNRLVVTGETKKEVEEEGVIRREFRSTRFERSFHVGNDVDPEGIKASMEDGVLSITLPKKSEKVGRKVEID